MTIKQDIEEVKASLKDKPDLYVTFQRITSYVSRLRERASDPIPILLKCPECGERHIDEGLYETIPHHTHACQHCGFAWRPAVVETIGVRFLPGFENNDER